MNSTCPTAAAAVLLHIPAQLGQQVTVQITHLMHPDLLIAGSLEVPATSRGTAHRDDHQLKHPQGRLPNLARAQQLRLHESPMEKRAWMISVVDLLISLQKLNIKR